MILFARSFSVTSRLVFIDSGPNNAPSVANLMHICDELRLDWDECEERAEIHYCAEFLGEESRLN
jgi:hypothetical protein